MATKALFYLLLVSCLLVSCQTKRPKKLTIATAANMQFAMDELVRSFTSQTGIVCETVISSSGKLTAQIEEGAPFDLLVSADMKYPASLYASGLATAPPRIYAFGKLVLWSMIDSLEPSIALLQDDQIRHIALANPKTAPYGLAAIEVLAYYNLAESLADKLVYGESISQTNQFIISKAAAIGFTAKSVVLSPPMSGKGHWRDLDAQLYTPIEQGMVIIKQPGDQIMAAQAFFEFLYSEKGKAILIRYGYEVDGVGTQE